MDPVIQLKTFKAYESKTPSTNVRAAEANSIPTPSMGVERSYESSRAKAITKEELTQKIYEKEAIQFAMY